MRTSFHEELSLVLDQLVQMAEMAGSAVHRAGRALLEADVQLADGVIAGDAALDRLREVVDARAIDLLARQSPVATDLRTVVTALQMSSNLERMGDLARHIAKVARMRFPDPAVPADVAEVFGRMGQVAEEICAAAGEAVRALDEQAAHEIEQLDDELDELHRDLFDRMLRHEWQHGTAAAVDTTLLSRYYERFGDHAVSVARLVQFLVTGEGDLEHRD